MKSLVKLMLVALLAITVTPTELFSYRGGYGRGGYGRWGRGYGRGYGWGGRRLGLGIGLGLGYGAGYYGGYPYYGYGWGGYPYANYATYSVPNDTNCYWKDDNTQVCTTVS